ncbi:unnamed protein product [Psylliodes chrysocephalus]|uniref:Motile sperm domain-containing protein 2 n=1 Tax=Psylliodes chrysocephalus TaxID=3402493 RepID=A0A9P0CT26_9CUCU|nr:unnamed protein product [Psylliodes chrysocephala]
MVKTPTPVDIVISQSEIEDLRKAFLSDYSSKNSDSVHPKDLEKIKTNDEWLRRFLLHQEGNKENALNMMWTAVTWRKEQNVNEINENTVKMDVLCSGGFFIHGADIDDCKLLVFKCNKHTKGAVDMDILKRGIIYWFERLERLTKGEKITIFFDMEGCGLSNMDMEVTKYLIELFKEYYPYFLNYILIYEMPWILSAAFKIIKSWLPEKAVEKIKFVSKKDLTNYVPTEHILKSWGGPNTYVFSFIPETFPEKEKEKVPMNNNVNNKKVHFVDGSMSEVTASSSGDKETDGGYLKVTPSGIITFVRDGAELISTLELQNTDDSIHVSYKLKTTSPEKFRVKPSTGCLAPGESANVNVTLLPGFQLGGLSRDKFLVMSTPMESNELQGLDLPELWKNTSGRKVYQHRLKCIQSGEITKNGNVTVSNANASEHDQNVFNKLSSSISEIKNAQSDLRNAVKVTQYIQLVTLFLVLLIGFILGYMMQNNVREISSDHSYCREMNNP